MIINKKGKSGTRFLVKEFGGWRVGNCRGEFQPGTCWEGPPFRKVRAGLEVTKGGREAPDIR